MDITELLLRMQDKDYKTFQCKLMPTMEKDRVIGIRIPLLRNLAKKLSREAGTDVVDFMKQLPHRYYEENNLHAFLIERIGDFEHCIAALDCFLPFVDNWSTCDSIRPKCFAENKGKLLPHIYRWIASGHEYTVRFGIGMLMLHYLDEDFSPAYPELVASIRREEYYIKMMIAWYFTTALAKQYDTVVKYLEERRLSAWVHNKTIQKVTESYRFGADIKGYLKMLRV